jgi:hypothetical protein
MIKNYKQFVLNRNESSINENLKQAAAYLGLNKISTDDSGFQKIRRLLSDQADSKLAYLFTKFFYVMGCRRASSCALWSIFVTEFT